jgi:predicted ester cyclase
MTDDDTRTVMEGYLGALLGGTDFDRFFAPDVVWTTMETGEEVHGRQAVRDLIVAMHAQAFEARPELVHLVCGDGTATVEAIFDGTQIGEFAGVPASGAHVRIPYAMGYDVSGGVITALRAYLPMTALRAQLTTAGHTASATPAG